jgi:hypothetical protein
MPIISVIIMVPHQIINKTLNTVIFVDEPAEFILTASCANSTGIDYASDFGTCLKI